MTAQPIVPADLFARTQTIAGLRALADFLEDNPGLPVQEYGWTLTVYPTGDDDRERAEVDRIAALLDTKPVDNRPRGGHYTVSRTFGRITYQAVHVPSRQMANHHALMSYAPAFRTHTETGTA
jgi:hypothetical protein